ncbi:MAG: M50 family metallopeptidase [Methanoregula sp.]|nr:MAG: M50 family metallopeptidase [Methanoregula sp.]
MDISGFFQFIVLAVMVILISAGLDRLFAQVVPFRTLYYAIRLPGVVLHEISHMIGCLLTGAEIRKVVYFSKEGGSVTYSESKIPILGTVIISTAPLFFLPLILAGLTLVFGTYFGCFVPQVIPLTGDLVAGSEDIFKNVITIFSQNLIVHPNGWFFLYLYLCGSIVLSLAPSGQDFKNAAIGIGALLVFFLLIVNSGFEQGISLISLFVAPMITAFSIGLMFEIITVLVALPFVMIYALRTT